MSSTPVQKVILYSLIQSTEYGTFVCTYCVIVCEAGGSVLPSTPPATRVYPSLSMATEVRGDGVVTTVTSLCMRMCIHMYSVNVHVHVSLHNHVDKPQGTDFLCWMSRNRILQSWPTLISSLLLPGAKQRSVADPIHRQEQTQREVRDERKQRIHCNMYTSFFPFPPSLPASLPSSLQTCVCGCKLVQKSLRLHTPQADLPSFTGGPKQCFIQHRETQSGDRLLAHQGK